MSEIKIAPKENFIYGYLALIVSLVFLMLSNFTAAVYCSFLGTFLICLGYFRIWYQGDIHNFIMGVIVLIILFVPVFGTFFISDYMNQQASEQTVCGVVENIKPHNGRSGGTFELVNDSRKLKFSDYDVVAKVLPTLPQSLCIEYMLDQRWSSNPYISKIEPHLN
ncbi:hypothetical protein [Acinetobacter sp. NIPH 298]|uniref:hypothetical protein n=1 Tax=Acinetobacter sp. NIPH 298 TaxID=1217692 RepID=UPI0002D0C449|nr:hypothetical protein [Acinetobacter sp. NIPH 298]ENW93555.1 hypothetical protein F903_02977 [Acinetobacter sp. NIPH 298]